MRIIALDILPMDSLPSVEFLQGDFTEDETLQKLKKLALIIMVTPLKPFLNWPKKMV